MPKTSTGVKRSAVRMSPAMACGLEQRLWGVGDIVRLVEEREAALD